MVKETRAEEEERKRQETIARQLALLKRQQRALQARENLLTFVQFTMPDPEDPNDIDRSLYVAGKHHVAVSKAIEDFVDGRLDCSILILTMPPRMGKSELVSRRLPAWFLGRFPRQNVVVSTYNDDFAADFGAEVRKIIQSNSYKQVFPNTKLIRGGTAKDRLQTTDGGQASFVGRGGSLTGRGAHLLVADDIIKDDKEAQSKAIRDQAWSWFTKVAMTRRMGRKLALLTFTRWHQDDPIGRLTDPENEHYVPELAEGIKIINLPMIAEDDDPLGRAPGELLWPEGTGPDNRYDQRFVNQQRALLGPLGFAALYQQRPTAEDGVLFSRDSVIYYDPHELPDDLRIYCASDHAVATEQRSDSTVLLKVGVDRHNHIWLLDCWWDKKGTDVVTEAMLAMGAGPRAPLSWWAEKGHISKSIGPFLRRRMMDTGTFFNVVEVTPSGDKEQRAQSISARMKMGAVRFPRHAPWTEKAISELLAFPNGRHDDFVDAFAYIGLGLAHHAPAGGKSAPKAEPRYGSLAWVKQQQRRGERTLGYASFGAR